MPPVIHQKSLIYKQLKKHLPLFLEHVKHKHRFIVEYQEVYKFPKLIARRNLSRYKRTIKYIEYILEVVEDESKKVI